MGQRRRLDPTVLHPEAQRLKEFLQLRLIGQKRAIDKVVRGYNYFLSPLWEPEKPIVCLMSMGPSGSGKTFLAELLALYFFGSKEAMTKIECENFVERHQIAKLIGAPPGYVGYDKDTIISQEKLDRFDWSRFFQDLHEKDEKYRQLQKEVVEAHTAMMTAKDKTAKQSLIEVYQEKRRSMEAYVQTKVDKLQSEKRPSSVVLFDEIEKAHSSLHNFLLEVTSKGRATLDNGDNVDFTRSFIIETSNVGSKVIADIAKGKGQIGIRPPQKKAAKTDEIYDAAIKEAKKVWSTEYLARHSKVVYHLLTPEQLGEILDICIGELLSRLRYRRFNFEVVIAPEVRQFILNEALDHPENGARLVRDKVRKHLDEQIASLINSNQVAKSDSKLYVDMENKDEEPRIVFSAENGDGEKKLLTPGTPGPDEDEGQFPAQQGRSRSRRIRIE